MQPVPVTERAPAPAKGIAAKLWSAARTEFSLRGYHGARVQGIARRAGCNVALLYRHWASKKALYLDVLGSVWTSSNASVTSLLEKESGAPGVVSAYLEALLDDYAIGWTMLQPGTPAILLLDRLPGWGRLYADETAVVHYRLPAME